MWERHWRHLFLSALSCALITTTATAQGIRGGDDVGVRLRMQRIEQTRRNDGSRPRALRGFQEPAFARGYSDGWEKGLDDGRDRDRYDPVRHGDFRSADEGYRRAYGPKEAYRNNYRAGFRRGYEDGYRDGARRRR